MAKRIFSWFVEPLDSHTNEVLSRELPEENFQRDLVCSDGKLHNLWVCTAQFVRNLAKSENYSKLDFRIFSRKGKSGKPRECTFIFKKGRKKLPL